MTTIVVGGRGEEPVGIRREIQAKPAERLSEHQQRSYTEYSLKPSKNYRLGRLTRFPSLVKRRSTDYLGERIQRMRRAFENRIVVDQLQTVVERRRGVSEVRQTNVKYREGLGILKDGIDSTT